MNTSLLADVFSWWRGQICALVFGERARLSREPDGLIVSVEDLTGEQPSGVLLLRKNGVETFVRRLSDRGGSLPRLPAFLRLPPGMVLSRRLALPLAAARDLHTVVAYEMNRLTPLDADEVVWGVSGIRPNRAHEKVTLQLSIALRAQVESLLAGLARLDLRPSCIEADGASIPLHAAQGESRLLPRNLWAWCCGMMTIACVTIPFLRQQIALQAADRAIAAHETAAHLGEAMRRRIAIANSSMSAIAAARRTGDALQVLATLTDALPEGTWLDDLSLSGGDLSIDGESDNAAKLISLLAGVPGVRGPSFTAPVTRSPDNRNDQFSLHATVGE